MTAKFRAVQSEKQQQDRQDWLLQHRMTPEDLDKQAAYIRDKYVEMRRQMFPAYRPSDKHMNPVVWRNTARRIIDAKVDVDSWVILCFDQYGDQTMPSHLGQAGVAKTMSDRMEAEIQQAETLLRLYSSKLRVLLEREKRPLAELLEDPLNNFGALFVWCIATRQGLTEVAARYSKEAARLMNLPTNRKVYTGAFPEVLQC